VYDTFDGSTFSNLLGSVSGTLANSGYHTIPLASPINLTTGNDFSIVVNFTTTGYLYPVPIEMDFAGYSSGATASPGQSYISSYFGGFTDITTSYENTNVCIRGLTLIAYKISGTVTSGGSPLSGVTMSGLPGNPVTDVNGFYSANVGSGWSGTVTPTKSNCTFTPSDRAYTNVTADQTNQDYTATSTPSGPPSVSGTITLNKSSSARTSATFSHTVPAGDSRLLVVSAMIEGNELVSSITYAGNNLTKANDSGVPSNGNGGCRVEHWYLVAPPVGTANVVVNFGTSVDPSGITAVNKVQGLFSFL
jgi:hypothetical protein